MRTQTYTQLITNTIQRLRQVSGLSTQLYSEGIIGQYLQEGYHIIRGEAWWPHLMDWRSGTIDGATGKVSSGSVFSGVSDFTDILAIYYGTQQQRLPVLDETVNPYSVLGTTARYVEPLPYSDADYSTKLFRVWPLTLTGTVRIRVRVDPTNLFTTPSVTVPFDSDTLINYAVWRYWTDDGANPGAAAAALQIYEKKKSDWLEKVMDQPVWLDPRATSFTDTWQEQ